MVHDGAPIEMGREKKTNKKTLLFVESSEIENRSHFCFLEKLKVDGSRIFKLVRSVIEPSSLLQQHLRRSQELSQQNNVVQYKMAKTAIELPGADYRILKWSVLNGALVRTGDKIAIAVPKDSATTTKTNTTGTASSSSTAAVNDPAAATQPTTTTTTTRKRASRRKSPKEIAAAVAAAAAAASRESDNNSQPYQNTVVAVPAPGPRSYAATAAAAMTAVGAVSITASATGIVRYQQVEPTTTTTDSALVCGWIESCSHPTIMDGICAVCGDEIRPSTMMPGQYLSSSAAALGNDDDNDEKSRSQITVAGLTVSISKEESELLIKHEAARLHEQQKLSLVLDLDHTLVHATADRRASTIEGVRSLVLPVPSPPGLPPPAVPQYMVHYVKLRPHVTSFLREAMDNYEIGVYTAGTRDYAEQIAILLAREMVGARYDQIDLDNIRRDIEYTKFKLKEQAEMALGNDASDKTDEAEPSLSGPVDLDLATGEQETEEKSNTTKRKRVECGKMDKTNPSPEVDPVDAEPSAAKKKRKRVHFEEPLPQHRPPPLTEDDLRKLETEISMADEKEREAMEFRRKLFGSRMVSRTEVGDLGRDVKSLKRVFPCGGNMAAVVDDREDVWANAKEIFSSRNGEPPDNLLLVKPFHWKPFQGFADVNNAAGQDLTQSDEDRQDEEVNDQQLRWTGDILRRVHAKYYAAPGTVTVPDLLREMRKEVLAGCKIVLSGLIPMANQNQPPNEPRPAVLRYVESMGGSVENRVVHTTTHVIGARDGTEKIHSARKLFPNCFVVRVSWLMECWWSLTKREENAHLLEPDHNLQKSSGANCDNQNKGNNSGPDTRLPKGSAKDKSSTNESDDDEEDAFLDELADEMDS
jgi:TFIIF-interacting CTD phosphatase-like protein